MSLAVAALALVLGGCTPITVTPSSSPTPLGSASASPSSSPTPAATISGKLAVGDLVATPDGIADSLGTMLVTVTKPIAPGDPAFAVVEWDDTVCGETEPGPNTGGWLPAYPLTGDGKYPFFPNMSGRSTDSPVQWISVQEPEIRTAEGLGIGSTVAELEAAYGAALVASDEYEHTGHSLHGTLGELVFWAQLDGTVDGIDIMAGNATPTFNWTTTPCA